MKNYKLFIIFLFISLMVSACARVDNVAESGNIKIEINRSNAREGGDLQMDNLWLELTIKGDYSEFETVQINKKKTVVEFKNIQIGLSIWAEASVYTIEGQQKHVYFTGQSKKHIVSAGENNLVISFKEAEIEDPYHIDDIINASEKIYVTTVENGGNDESGDGSQGKPFKSLSRAVSKMNNAEMAYTIMVDGKLTDCQEISGLSQDPNDTDAPNHAAMVFVSGVNGNETDGIFVESQEGSYGLRINTDVNVWLTNIRLAASDYNILSVETDSNVVLKKDVVITNTASSVSEYQMGYPVSVSGSLSMMDNSTITGIKAYNSPVNLQGDLIMSDNSSISECYSRQAGAVTITASGTFSMFNNSSITDCHCVDGSDGMGEFGGAVHITSDADTDAKFSMTDNSKIEGCSAKCGGGALIEKGQMLMLESSSVTGNTASIHNYSMTGAGVCVNTNGTLLMSGGSITENIGRNDSDEVYGIGICNFGTLMLLGGYVEGNITSGGLYTVRGSGIYNKHTFQIGGDSYIADSNDVYLDIDSSTGNKAYITIMSHLTHDHVAKIITSEMVSGGSEYPNGQVLKAVGNVELVNEYMKFTGGTYTDNNGDEYTATIDYEGNIH